MGASLVMSDLLRVMKRWYWAIILVPLLCSLAAAILVFYVVRPTYETSTTLLIGRNTTIDQQASLRYEDLILSQQLVKTYGEIVESWTVLEEVIHELNLPLSVEQFKRKIDVNLVNGTQIIRLSVYDRDPALAQQIANSTAAVFAQRVPALMKLNNVAILDPARLPIIPAKPRKAVVVTMAGTAGLLGVLTFIFAAEYLDGRIRNKGEAEKLLDLPVLGTIPKSNTTPGGDASFLPLVDDPKSPTAEAFRSLRTNVQFHCNRKGIRLITVTSAQPAEGKTTVATNLAIGIAQTGKRVILVDADLRRPMLHKVMCVPNGTGLSDLLMGTSEVPEELIVQTPIVDLMLLPSGPVPSNPAELLGNPRFMDILEYLRSISDLVILDTPPLAAVTDAAITASLVDGVLLVTSGTDGRTDIQAKGALRQVNATIMGVILNRVSVERERYYDYYRV